MLKNGTLGFTGDSACEKRLTGTGWPDQQYAPRNPSTELLKFLRISQEIDQLGDFFLRLVATGHIREVDRVVILVDQFGARFPE